MKLFSALAISGSGLTAEKLRLDVIAGNLANINTTRTAGGGPYRHRAVVFAEELKGVRGHLKPGFRGFSPASPSAGSGVRVQAILSDLRPPRVVYDPEHPDAGLDGFVAYPNIELAKEITGLITAQRSYEANVTALNTAKSLYLKALEIGR